MNISRVSVRKKLKCPDLYEELVDFSRVAEVSAKLLVPGCRIMVRCTESLLSFKFTLPSLKFYESAISFMCPLHGLLNVLPISKLANDSHLARLR